MSFANTALDVAEFIRERKGIKEEKKPIWDILRKITDRDEDGYRKQNRGLISSALGVARLFGEQKRGLWDLGREEKTGFTGALPYTVKGKEPGLKIQHLKTRLAEEKEYWKQYLSRKENTMF